MASNLVQRGLLVRLQASKLSKATEHSARQEGSGIAVWVPTIIPPPKAVALSEISKPDAVRVSLNQPYLS